MNLMPRLVPAEVLDRSVQLRGSVIARALLRLMGWRLLFEGLPAKQGVVVLYPHTSNWDFLPGILAKWAMGFPATVWSKDSLFRLPLVGRWLRWVGIRPVVRGAKQGMVGQMAAAMQEAKARDEFMWLALTPEGTRSLTTGWRMGFYHVAMQAQVPVGLAVLDFGRREVGFKSIWNLSGDVAADFAVFAQVLSTCRGCKHELAAPVRPIEK